MTGNEYPVRPGEKDCPFYLKTGRCGFGEICRFNHPKREQSKEESLRNENAMRERENSEKRDEEEAKETDTRTESASMEETEGKDKDLGTSESDRRHERDPRSSSGAKKENATQTGNELGQLGEYRPVRSGVADCKFYLKKGRCGLGRRCRFNHPPMRDDMAQPSTYPARPESSQMMRRHDMAQPSPYPYHPERSKMRDDMVQPSSYPARPESSQMMRRNEPSPYPGVRDCTQYLQTGQCSYGPKCRFNHPPPPPHISPVLPQRVSLKHCKFFQRGNCRNGSGCKFTHSRRGDGGEPMRQGTTSSSRGWKREMQAHDLDEQKQKKRKVETLRIGSTVQSGEGGIQTQQRLVIQENQQEQADMERQNKEAEEKAQEERRQQIDNERRQARLRLEQMRPRVVTDNVDQVRTVLPDIGIDRKEGDGF